METSLKTGFAQIFSCCPKKLSCPKFGGAAAPLAPPARTPMRGRGDGGCDELKEQKYMPSQSFNVMSCQFYQVFWRLLYAVLTMTQPQLEPAVFLRCS